MERFESEVAEITGIDNFNKLQSILTEKKLSVAVHAKGNSIVCDWQGKAFTGQHNERVGKNYGWAPSISEPEALISHLSKL